jgi:hypothetical protein
LGVGVELTEGLPEERLARSPQDVTGRGIAFKTIAVIVKDQDSVEDMLKDRSEFADSSIGGAVAGALLAPDQLKIETENKYAEDDANQQRRDKESGVAA